MRAHSILVLPLLLLLACGDDRVAPIDASAPADAPPEVDAPGAVDAPTSDAPSAQDAPIAEDAAAIADAACADPAAQLEPLVEDLFYTSEGDEPLVVAVFTGEGTAAPDAADVLRLSGAPADATTEMRTVDDFFMRVVVDPTASPPPPDTRPAMLRAAAEGALDDLIVVRVIDPATPARIGVYLVGRTTCGDLAWLSSTAIET